MSSFYRETSNILIKTLKIESHGLYVNVCDISPRNNRLLPGRAKCTQADGGNK